MSSPEYDLKFLQAGLVDLEGYLLSKEIYWPVVISSPPGEAPYPRLTLGSLLLAQARLQSGSLTPEQRTAFERLNQRINEARQRWQVAWSQKAAREFHARLNLWRDYIEDYRKDPGGNVDRYDYEVSRRVMLELLQREAEGIPEAELDLLSGLDSFIRSVLRSGDFIWENEIQDVFPKSRYWYLYGRPRGSN
ncbi:MAG: hypothetical protein EHM70_19315 [Chloroflexota bacterium]|nr:MAG: hypothetical protein EHM70_19315 [Chloroflexota bacterium]